MVNPKHSVLLFAGSDSYSKEKALDELRSALLNASSRELDYKVFYGDDVDIRELIDCASTIPLLSPKKIIVIKEAEKLSRQDRARLGAYIKKGIGSTCLVLQCADDSLLEEDGLVEYVSVRRFDNLTDRELGLWIERFVNSKSGKSILPDAIEVLRELQGADLLSLSQELEKLIAFVGEKKEIGSSDVEELVGKSVMATAFDLTAAIEKSKIDDAMRIIADLTLSGKRHYEIVGLLCWHLRRMMKARILRDKGESDLRIANALRLSGRYAGEFFNQLNGLDIGKLKARMKVLLDADLDLKRTKYNPSLVLEFALIRLCLTR